MEALENVYAGWRRKLMRYIADTVDFELKEPTDVYKRQETDCCFPSAECKAADQAPGTKGAA